ncbi:GlxA family transcriptional regulator [Flavobacterium silvaticum]|uniref:Helix-turn-helix domain-containing protein n=1 Tax=Flavobacterium silvaticum TaxID=1852020 RepID=A0A972FZ57_9FLAO|nr:helix-turn-helix domain-containing protein [Flavobacterium silvaticum]NMH27486.1 helix-turn-helix domain-containing protein [Flavobacterium silvaticum]
MKHLTILVPEGKGNNISSIAGAYKIFSRANDFRSLNGSRPVFTIELVGLSGSATFYDGLFSVRPHKQLREVKSTDLIIIPSLNHAFDEALKQNSELVNWLKEQHAKGAEIASICTGAFLLAATGIIDGKKCSTHWAAADELRKRYPTINLQPDLLITDEDGIYTNGGAYSFLNLMIYLVEKFYGRETAIYCSKVFQIDTGRDSQASFAIFNGQKRHGDDLVLAAQEFMEKRVAEKFSVDGLCDTFRIGRRSFDRRFLRATGNSALEYMQRIRIETAKKALESSVETVAEIMYGSGYSDAKAFRDVFRKITGLSPAEYRLKYQQLVF